MFIVWVILALLALLAGLYLYGSSLPAAKLRQRILSRENEILHAKLDSQKRLDQLNDNTTRKKAEADAEARKTLYQSIGVEELARYDGIGMGIVANLQEAGYRTLQDLKLSWFSRAFGGIQARNVGEKRKELIDQAIRQLEADVEKRLQRGSFNGADTWKRTIQQIEREAEEDRASLAQHIEKCLSVLRSLEPMKQKVASQHPVALALGLASNNLQAEDYSFSLPTVPTRDSAPTVAKTAPQIDTESTPADSARPTRPDPEVEAMIALMRLGYTVARIDGRVAQVEANLLRQMMAERYGSQPALYNRMDALLEKLAEETLDASSAIANVRELVPSNDWPWAYRYFTRIAETSSGQNAKEIAILEQIRQTLQISDESFTAPSVPVDDPFTRSTPPAITPAPKPTPAVLPTPAPTPTPPPTSESDPRLTLEIAPDVSLNAELIRRQYNLLLKRLDLDQAQRMGPEFVHMVEAKRAAVQAAAERLIQPFGVPLVEVKQAEEPKDPRHNPELDAIFG